MSKTAIIESRLAELNEQLVATRRAIGKSEGILILAHLRKQEATTLRLIAFCHRLHASDCALGVAS